jgi:hypothetical protein
VDRIYLAQDGGALACICEHSNAFLCSIKGVKKLGGGWYTIIVQQIIGMIFFYTVNSDQYVSNILNHFLNQLTVAERQYLYFQQDIATAYIANWFITAVCEIFENRIINNGLWLPRSPDPGYSDFYL